MSEPVGYTFGEPLPSRMGETKPEYARRLAAAMRVAQAEVKRRRGANRKRAQEVYDSLHDAWSQMHPKCTQCGDSVVVLVMAPMGMRQFARPQDIMAYHEADPGDEKHGHKAVPDDHVLARDIGW